MNCALRSLRHLIQYLNEHKVAKITVDLKVFNPKAPPHRLIVPFTQDDITAMLSNPFSAGYQQNGWTAG